MRSNLLGNTFVVAGEAESIPDVLSLLEAHGIPTRNNPDLYLRSYRHFGIDEARDLRERAILRGLCGRRIFAIAAADINREAQNALLKTLEESPGDALFFFMVPSPDTLLPTFRSRAQIVDLANREIRAPDMRADSFLTATPQKRLDLLKPLLEKGSDDMRDLGAILSFLASLESRLAENPAGLLAVYRARKYVADRGALVKPLLEQVALLLPRV